MIAAVTQGPVGLLGADEAAKGTVLKLCSQAGPVPGKSMKEKIELLQKWGAAAIELAGNPDVKEVQDALKGSSLKVSALCWGSHAGDLVSPDKAKQTKGIDDLKIALDKAGELQAAGVIFVPTFNNQSKLKPEELDKVLLDILPALGDYAQKCKTHVILEPLNKKETFYLNRVEQAVAICEKLNNPGIAAMGDFYHMSKEEKSDEAAFITGGRWLRHVHLATGASRILPGQEDHSYVAGFRGLKKIGYQGFCSFESGCKKGTDRAEEMPKAMAFLRKQWDEAAV
jgi:sugar phosphate isomerase/epimerase